MPEVLLAHEQVTVRRAATVGGPYGANVPDWDTVTETVERANVQPAGVTEDVAGADRIEARYELRLRADADVTEADRIRWQPAGAPAPVDLEVIAVRPWRQGPPALRHLHVIAQRVTG